MKPIYVPIIKAKKGEFDALDNIDLATHEKILPLFELPRLTEQTLSTKKYRDEQAPTELFVREISQKVSNSRGKFPVMLDFFKWPPNSKVESGEHVLNFAMAELHRLGVSVIPAIGYDRWEDVEYQNALSNLRPVNNQFTIRLESYAFEDMREDLFDETLQEILETLNLDEQNCNIILDLGSVTTESLIDIQEELHIALKALSSYNFRFISIAGCSITSSINDMVPETDSDAIILRREMVAWQALKVTDLGAKLIFGDYGISSPDAADSVRAQHANGKIRYTIGKNYFVVRGHSRQIRDKGTQMHGLAHKVVTSEHYMSSRFSWGDKRIYDCSQGMFIGNLTNWISIDLNHHLKAVVAEIFEFESTTAISRKQKVRI